jgi:hypothetical protein
MTSTKQQNKKNGDSGDTVIVTSSGIRIGTAQEQQQNPVLVFSITLMQKKVRPPVWIILVPHAELASVRALLVKGLDHSNLPYTFKIVCDVPCLLHAHTNKIQKMQIQILTNTYKRHTHTHTHTHTQTHTHTHTQTPTHKHMHTTPSDS